MPQTNYFDCYNLHGKQLTDLRDNASFGIYGANNRKQIQDLRAAGATYPVVQYWNGNGGEHGGVANVKPPVLNPLYKFKSNNVIGIEGGAELVRLLTNHRDWFVQYPDGRIAESLGRWTGNLYFNMLNPAAQAYWLQQTTKHMLEGVSGVFLDNLSAYGFTAMSGELVTTATYGAGNSQAFLDSQLNWLRITKEHLTASGKKLYANISKSHKNPDYFKAMMRHLDGVMLEHAFSDQSIDSDFDLIRWLTEHGKEVLIVAQCKPHETAKIEHLTACYKLVECPLTYIRYSADDAYGNWWIPDAASKAEQLITPLEFALKQGEIRYRRFYAGHAWVNTGTRDSGIEITKPLPITPPVWENPTPYRVDKYDLVNGGVEVRVHHDDTLRGVMQLPI